MYSERVFSTNVIDISIHTLLKNPDKKKQYMYKGPLEEGRVGNKLRQSTST